MSNTLHIDIHPDIPMWKAACGKTNLARGSIIELCFIDFFMDLTFCEKCLNHPEVILTILKNV